MYSLLKQRFYILARRKKIRNYIASHRIRKLHLGCKKAILEGWLNTDMFPEKNIVYLNVKKPFPFNSNTFDYIFCEHLIEHLECEEGIRFLGECFRSLKPGGKIRIATPDLRFLVELKNPEKTDLQKRYIAWSMKSFLPDIAIHQDAFVINNFFRDWGHKFIYDFVTLQQEMQGAGFRHITRCGIGQSENVNLRNLESHGKEISHEFNALETFVVEGTK